MNELAACALAWLLTYLVHSSLLLGGVSLVERMGLTRSGALLSGLWRAALFGAVLTATLQVLFATSPLHGRVRMPVSQATTARPVAQDPPPVDRVQSRSGVVALEDNSRPLRGGGDLPTPASSPAASSLHDSGPSIVSRAATWSGRHWPWLVLSAWAALALVLLLRLGLAVRAARCTLGGRRRLHDRTAVAALESLCREAGMRRVPRLSVCASLYGPVSLPNGEICLPPWTLEHLAPGQLRAMLAHELAHCRRHDPLWQLAGNIVGALLFMQPLNRVARAGVASSAELACDDWAAVHMGDRRALAECLFECLSRTQGSRPPVLGSAMAVPGSALTRRVGRLLSGIQLFNGELSMKARIVIIGALAVLAFAAPGFLVTTSLAQDAPAPPAAPASPASVVTAARAQAAEAASQAAMARQQAAAEVRKQAVEMHKQAQVMRQQAVIERHQARVMAQTHKTVEREREALAREVSKRQAPITGHDSISVSRNGHDMSISLDQKGLSVKLHADGEFAFNAKEDDLASLGAGGRMDMTVTQGDSSRRVVFTNEGGKGIKRAYYVNGSSKPFDAQARQWLAGILPEILRETALNAKARIARILKQGGPGAVLAEIGKIHGGYARSVYIRDFARSGPLKSPVVDKLIAQAAAIDSGYEKEQALIGLYRGQHLQGKQLSALLKAGAGIESGYEKSQLLQAVAGKMPLDKANVKTYLGMAASIDSDYEMRMALKALLLRPGLKKEPLVAIMAMAAAHMDSAYDLRTTLALAAPRVDGSGPAARAYCQAARGIDSSYDRRIALSTLLHKAKLNKAGYLCVLEAAAGISSDYDRSTLLVSVARRMPNDAALEAKYREIAKGIGSDYDRRRAEDALRKRG